MNFWVTNPFLADLVHRGLGKKLKLYRWLQKIKLTLKSSTTFVQLKNNNFEIFGNWFCLRAYFRLSCFWNGILLDKDLKKNRISSPRSQYVIAVSVTVDKKTCNLNNMFYFPWYITGHPRIGIEMPSSSCIHLCDKYMFYTA